MKEMFLLKLGEIVLKGANRRTFEETLKKNVRRTVSHFGAFKVYIMQSTVYVEPQADDCDLDGAWEACGHVFGVSSMCRCRACEKDLDAIYQAVVDYLGDELSVQKSFKVESKRSDKSFPLNSIQISQEIGGRLAEAFPQVAVDVHTPTYVVNVEVRDFAAYIHGPAVPGAGGLPTGTGGRAAVLLSGGIDSPVAGYMIAKRGVELECIHFFSYPYTSERAKEKVLELAKLMTRYCGRMTVDVVGFTEIQEAVVRIAALTGSEEVELGKRAVLVLCADNGVVAEGVTQTDASVTATMAGEIAKHRSSVCRMAARAGADVFAIDIGMNRRVEGVRDCHTADGTQNMTKGPAMTRAQAEQAIQTGMELVHECRDAGYRLLATGEMGIGNTTTSSAVTAVLLGLPIEEVTGRGAGLSNEGLIRKLDAIHRAIEVNRPDAADPMDVLCKLGGFDIAGMTGIFLGGALYRVPVLIDGLISSVAALLAARLCPNARCAMLASHCSAEPAARQILQELGVHAVLDAGLKLGEGTGAVCMMPLLDMALAVYRDSAGFADAGVGQYTVQKGDRR